MALSDSGFVSSGEIRIQYDTYRLRILKVNDNGAIVWEKSYGDSGLIYTSINDGLIRWKDGYLAIGGYHRPGYYAYGHLTAFSSTGDSIFTKLFTDSVYQLSTDAITIHSDNSISVAGRLVKDTTEMDCFISRLDTNANEIWRKYYNFSQVDGISKIECTADGGYLVSGYKRPASYYQGLVFKTDSLGNIQWQKIIAKGRDHTIKAIELPNSSILIYGHIRDTIGTGLRAYISHISSSGQNIYWEKEINGYQWAALHDVITHNDGSFTFCGSKNTVVNYPIGWLLKINSIGDIIFERHFPEFSSSNYLFSLTKAPDNGYVCAGYGWDTSGTTQGWILKVDSNGCESPVCIAPVEEILNEISGFKIYPNPSGGKFFLESSAYPCEISIYDINGRLVLNKTLQQAASLVLQESGLYLISLTDRNGKRETGKLVITN